MNFFHILYKLQSNITLEVIIKIWYRIMSKSIEFYLRRHGKCISFQENNCLKINFIFFPSNFRPLNVIIVAKTHMKNGFCYICYSEEFNCLLRPIYNIRQSFWDPNFNFQVSISSTFYKQLLRGQIPKAQKYSQSVSLFWAFEIFACKSFEKMLVKSTPGVWSISIFQAAFLCNSVFFAAVFFLQFGFVIFWQNNIGAKAASKMLVRLTTGV